MTLAQLRKAAHALNLEPWTIIQQTDLLVSQLAQNGVLVHDEKPKDVQKWLLGGAALLALVAGAAAAASLTAKGQPSAAGTSTAKRGEDEEDAQTTTKKASP
jgi:ribosomal protein L12E/L44/L45/RPP1/RPP2